MPLSLKVSNCSALKRPSTQLSAQPKCMNKRLAIIKQKDPKQAEREDVRDITEDIDRYATLTGFASSEAGGLLLGALTQDAAESVTAIMLGYKTLPEIELRGLAARLEA